MGGIDENFSMFGDWSASNPSPRTFFASLIGESLLSENGNEVPLGQQQEQKSSSESRVKDEEEFAFETIKGPAASTASVLSIPKPRTGSGLAGRIAAKSGFNALKINISHATTVSLPSPAADGSSPLVTIPPGLSPTSLLDSPVFLFNSLAQPSPTTGKFPLTQNTYSSSMMSEVAQENKLLSCVDTTCNTSFAFKPQMETAGSLKIFPGVDSQSHLVTGKVLNQPERSSHSGSFIANGSHPQKQQPVAIADFPQRMSLAGECKFSQVSNPSTGNEGQPGNILDGKKQKADPGTVAVEQQSEDGYNWRKYGQKQVKGSENPRSYYKCTHPNCEAKKKVERTLEGRLIEITYQGDHLHPKPPPNRRATPPQLNAFNEIHGGGLEMFDSQSGNENKPTWTNQRNDAASYDIRSNGHDASSSLSLTADFSNPSASINTHDDSLYEYTDTIDASSTISNEDDEQTTTNQNACLSADGNEDEPESKKRKLECSVMDAGVDVNASRAVNREPRVVVQTTSEVDILDDGYRWRKYGQKVVKGNPNPRSYYKCTSAGCPVRKHVERASHDLKSVITTYEGKHNHEVPAARNSGHTSSNSSGLGVSSVAQSHSRRPEHTNLLEGNSRFNMHPNMGSYGVPRAMQAGLPTGFSLGLGQPGMANLAMARYAATTQAHAMHPMQSYFGQRPMGELVMVVPKGEPKGEAMQSDDASEYQQFLGGPTLEPQM